MGGARLARLARIDGGHFHFRKRHFHFRKRLRGRLSGQELRGLAVAVSPALHVTLASFVDAVPCAVE